MPNDGKSGYPVKVGDIFKIFSPAKSGHNVVAVTVGCGCIQNGDEICFGNPEDSGAVKQIVDSLEVDGRTVLKVNQGISCGILVDGIVPTIGTEVWITEPTAAPIEITQEDDHRVRFPYALD